jgi:serine peptidase DegS
MGKTIEIAGFVLRAIIAGLALAFLLTYFWPELMQKPAVEDQLPVVSQSQSPDSYAEAVDRAAPAVVSIYTSTLEPVPEEVQRQLGSRYLYRTRHDMGSGVLIDESGYILTNYHVIYRVSNIQVALWDNRKAPAKVVGSDPATDLAVLKIEATGLPVAPIAENPNLRVGDVVLAIGNALGLSHTVTMGIISATRRNDLGALGYQDFIQIDAAINSGNSGGALINSKGDLIGINTRHLGSMQGAENIGFAIPISIARNVMQQIIEYGSVKRGWLGAVLSDLRVAVLADGNTPRTGVFVRSVTRGGPAWQAGIRPGDFITAADGETTDDAQAFLLAVSQRLPGSEISLNVTRQNESFETYATLIQQPPLE